MALKVGVEYRGSLDQNKSRQGLWTIPIRKSNPKNCLISPGCVISVTSTTRSTQISRISKIVGITISFSCKIHQIVIDVKGKIIICLKSYSRYLYSSVCCKWKTTWSTICYSPNRLRLLLSWPSLLHLVSAAFLAFIWRIFTIKGIFTLRIMRVDAFVILFPSRVLLKITKIAVTIEKIFLSGLIPYLI